jgi:hypothetical protein
MVPVIKIIVGMRGAETHRVFDDQIQNVVRLVLLNDVNRRPKGMSCPLICVSSILATEWWNGAKTFSILLTHIFCFICDHRASSRSWGGSNIGLVAYRFVIVRMLRVRAHSDFQRHLNPPGNLAGFFFAS